MYLKLYAMLREMKLVLVLTLVVLLVMYLGRKFSRNPRCAQLSKKLPGPYALPIVGNIPNLLLGAKDGMERLFSHYASIYGSTFRLWIGKHFFVVLSDVEDIQTVLFNSNCLQKSELFLFLRSMFGNSLPFADPVAWKHKRKAYQPVFNKNCILPQMTVMNEEIYKSIEEMKTLVDGPESDWNDVMDVISLNTFCRIYLNTDVNYDPNELYTVVEQLARSLERHSASMILNCPALIRVWNWFEPLNLATKESIAHTINRATDWIKNSTATFTETEGKADRLNSCTPATVLTMRINGKIAMVRLFYRNLSLFLVSLLANAQTFLQTLKRVQSELGEDDLFCLEIASFLTGATETSGATAAGCFFVLAAHPEIQDKVYAEIDQVFGEDDRPADKSDLEKLPYLDQVIKETLRLLTVAPLLMRVPQNDIKIGPHIYPAGTTIMLNIGAVHHDPKLYPDPYRFNPDNFSSESIKNRHRCSFLAFSSGPRDCIGRTLAEMTIKLRLIAFLRTFTFHTTKKMEDFKMKPRIVERSAFGYPMSITLRRKFEQNEEQ